MPTITTIPDDQCIGDSLVTINNNFANLLSLIEANSVPTGTIAFYSLQTAPAGWIKCDGSTITNTGETAKLYALIGNTLPDLQGKFIRGVGGNSASFGVTQQDDFKSHTHSDAGHTHTVYGVPAAGISQSGSGSDRTLRKGNVDTTTGSGNANIQATGGTETRPINVAYLPCIKL